jgi:hypothetical protein
MFIKGATWQEKQLKPILDQKDAEIESWKKERDDVLEMGDLTIKEWEDKYKTVSDSHASMVILLKECYRVIGILDQNNPIHDNIQSAIEKANQLTIK